MRALRTCFILGLLVGGVHGERSTWRSRLFPEDWKPGHRDAAGRFLHDFSYAGYRNGEAALPDLARARRFEVEADATGATDAGPAIQAAIDAAEAAGGRPLSVLALRGAVRAPDRAPPRESPIAQDCGSRAACLPL